jgi:hypothetical protein
MKEGDLVSRENCQHRPEIRQPLSLQCVDLHEPYTALIDMGMIWRMATPSAEDSKHKMTSHTSGLTTSKRCHRSSFRAMLQLNVSSV